MTSFFTLQKKFLFFQQRDAMDCGPTCVMMVAHHYGKKHTLPFLRDAAYITREGVSAAGIVAAAEKIGLQALAVKILYNEPDASQGSLSTAPLPCVVHWNQNHFVVVHDLDEKNVWVADPAQGKFKISRSIFEKCWLGDGDKGIAILLEPTKEFYNKDVEKQRALSFGSVIKYLYPHGKLIFGLLLCMLIGTSFGLITPFLSQALIDTGISTRNVAFVFQILACQLVVFALSTLTSIVQSQLLIHIGTRVNIAMVNDFLLKLMRLPISYFDSKTTGDLMQRINDQSRIESFLTSSSISIIFSVFNFFLYSIIILLYNSTIFFIWLGSAILYFSWIVFFLKYRKRIDYARFQQNSRNQSSIIETIQGMTEIKLQGAEEKRRKQWISIQSKSFRLSLRSLYLGQIQDAGASVISQGKDIFIFIIAVKGVIDGTFTLGALIAIQYMIGQLNAPLQQFMGFIRSAQDAKISMERLNEIHQQPDEEEVLMGTVRKPDDKKEKKDWENLEDDEPIVPILQNFIPANANIKIENLSFKYNELYNFVLKDLNVTIPHGKITAIVGSSGSGKTTFVKLLLGMYMPTKGTVRLNNLPLKALKPDVWRTHCGAVMQEGFLFSESIAQNIAGADEQINVERLINAAKIANIQEFIEELPNNYSTKIGSTGLSGGQKQRLSIARAVYKNPDYLFFDEATNALDATNERTIVENLKQFYTNKTVVIVAHRLSTVKNADQILVLERGALVECGTHTELTAKKGIYHTLVKDQLELGE